MYHLRRFAYAMLLYNVNSVVVFLNLFRCGLLSLVVVNNSVVVFLNFIPLWSFKSRRSH